MRMALLRRGGQTCPPGQGGGRASVVQARRAGQPRRVTPASRPAARWCSLSLALSLSRSLSISLFLSRSRSVSRARALSPTLAPSLPVFPSPSLFLSPSLSLAHSLSLALSLALFLSLSLALMLSLSLALSFAARRCHSPLTTDGDLYMIHSRFPCTKKLMQTSLAHYLNPKRR